MIADYFTKPLQGSLFLRSCDVILGHSHPKNLLSSPPTTSEEVRFGNKVQTVEVLRSVAVDNSSGTTD